MSEAMNESQGGAIPEATANEASANEASAQEQAQPSQAMLNAVAAKNRRAMQRELAEAKKKAATFDEFNAVVREMSENPDANPLDFISQLQEVADKAKSEEQLAKENIIGMEKKLTAAQQEAAENRQRYESAMVQRSISDSAAEMVVDGLGREGALEYFQLKLGPKSQVNEDGSVVVEWPVVNENTGKTETQLIPVKQALQAMEAEPTKYGRYFRSTVNGGAGGETIDGINRTPDGGIDFANMDFHKFQELSKKNPALLQEAANKLTF